MMSQAINKNCCILFDDQKFMLLGIPLVGLLVPMIFLNSDYRFEPQYMVQETLEGMAYALPIWIIVRQLMIFFRKRYPSITETHRRIAITIGSIIIVTLMVKLAVSFFVKSFYQLSGIEEVCRPSAMATITSMYFMTTFIVVIYEAIYFFKKYQEAIVEKQKVQTANVQAQLDNLRNQINPHFLFNSLNTLMNLIPKDENKAMTYLDKLSKFYRYSVGKKEELTVPLISELDNAKIYGDLLSERFGDNISLTIKNHLPPSTYILPMTMQLLIENAVKHNIVSSKKPLQITIYTAKDGSYIYVKNNLQKKIQSVESTGMGLDNIKERYSYFTDDEVKTTIEDGEFEIAIPLLTKDDMYASSDN